MNPVTILDPDVEVLNKSLAQLTHFITVAHQTSTAHLLARTPTDPTPPGTPDTTDLTAILNNAVAAPGTTSIATVPTAPDNSMLQLLQQVQTLDSYVSLLTAFCVYNEHPVPYDITKSAEAGAFTCAMAKWRNYVLTGGAVHALAGYLPPGNIVSQPYSKQVTSVDLHLEFLTELFGAFAFPEATLIELDSILTKVVSQLSSLKLSFQSQSTTLDHFLTYYFFDTVPGTGGKNQPPAIYEAKVRTFYLHIDQSAWKASVGKSSADHFQFSMNYFDMTSTMASALVANDMASINTAIQTLTGKTASEINKLMNMQAVHADPKP